MIDVQYASLSSQGVQHRVFYLDGHPSRYQPRPTGLNFGEQMGTGVFPLVIAVPLWDLSFWYRIIILKKAPESDAGFVNGLYYTSKHAYFRLSFHYRRSEVKYVCHVSQANVKKKTSPNLLKQISTCNNFLLFFHHGWSFSLLRDERRFPRQASPTNRRLRDTGVVPSASLG